MTIDLAGQHTLDRYGTTYTSGGALVFPDAGGFARVYQVNGSMNMGSDDWTFLAIFNLHDGVPGQTIFTFGSTPNNRQWPAVGLTVGEPLEPFISKSLDLIASVSMSYQTGPSAGGGYLATLRGPTPAPGFTYTALVQRRGDMLEFWIGGSMVDSVAIPPGLVFGLQVFQNEPLMIGGGNWPLAPNVPYAAEGMRGFIESIRVRRGEAIGSGAPAAPVGTVYRIFFWYDPGAATSTHAYTQADYPILGGGANGTPIYGSREVWVNTMAPSGKFLADIRPESSYKTYERVLYWSVSGDLQKGGSSFLQADGAPYRCAVAYDADADNIVLFSQVHNIGVGSDEEGVREDRIDLADGSLISTEELVYTSATGAGQWGESNFVIRYLSKWRGWGYQQYASYYIRDETTHVWDGQAPTWCPRLVPFTGFIVGGLLMQSDATLVLARLEYQGLNNPQVVSFLRSTDGITFTESRLVYLPDADGLRTGVATVANSTTTAAVTPSNTQQLILAGTAASFYFHCGNVAYVVQSDSTGTTWTTSRLTVDGVDVTNLNSPRDFVGNADGSCVLARQTVFDGSVGIGKYVVTLVKSTDGIAFVTLDPGTEIDCTIPGGDYIVYEQELLRPLFCDGTRFLYERRMVLDI